MPCATGNVGLEDQSFSGKKKNSEEKLYVIDLTNEDSSSDDEEL